MRQLLLQVCLTYNQQISTFNLSSQHSLISSRTFFPDMPRLFESQTALNGEA